MKILFTKNGLPAGKPILAPPRANDVHIVWAGGTGGWLEIAILTVNGKPVRVVWPPPGANDVDIGWTSNGPASEILADAYWTCDGEPIGPIPLPPGTNDFHFKWIPLP